MVRHKTQARRTGRGSLVGQSRPPGGPTFEDAAQRQPRVKRTRRMRPGM